MEAVKKLLEHFLYRVDLFLVYADQ